MTHYAIYLNCSTNTTIDYNDYEYSQQFGTVNGTTYTTLGTWKSGNPTFDVNSKNTDPKLVNLGGILASDYQTSVALTGTPIVAVPTDFGNITRSSSAPTMGAWEFFPYPVEVWIGGAKMASYSTLKGAFDKINDGTHKGNIIILFKGNTTENPSAVLYQNGYNGTSSYTKVLIYPARSGVIVSGSIDGALMVL